MLSAAIKEFHSTNKMNIIRTEDDIYYCAKGDDDTEYTPIPLGLNKHNDTIKIRVQNTCNNHYWAYSLIMRREYVYLMDGPKLVFKFEEPAFEFGCVQFVLISLYVLNDRWVVSIIYNTWDKTIMCRTHDVLGHHPAKLHLLSGIKPTQQSVAAQTYSDGTNYVLIYTPEKIARVSVCPDAGDSITRLNYKVIDNNIKFVNRREANTWLADVSLVEYTPISQPEKRQINVHYKYGNCKYAIHAYKNGKVLIGTINPDTLENMFIGDWQDHPPCEQPVIAGFYEYLAPDIIIQRPDISKFEQYLVLLAADGRQIRINIHEYEENKEQRNLYYMLQNDTGRIATLIFRKHADKSFLIYQADRQEQTITYRYVANLCSDPFINTTADGCIVLRDFALTGSIQRLIMPATTSISAVCSRIPATIQDTIARFMKQKIIHY
jgi:hypothetical protein